MKTILSFFFIVILFVPLVLAQSTDPVVAYKKPLPKSYHEAFPQSPRLRSEGPTATQQPIWNNRFLNTLNEHPGAAFFSSALLPGLGQLGAKSWIKAGVFAGIEVSAIATHFLREAEGRKGERAYERFADQNWSVMKYAIYLVDFHNHYYPLDQQSIQRFAMPGVVLDRNNIQYGRLAWPLIDIVELRAFERTIRFGGTSGNPLSHPVQDFGSQQYYELMSKYGQFGPGWRDFAGEYYMHPANMTWSVYDMSPMFWEGAQRAREFNENLRTARLMFSVLMANHAFAAFDAFFSTKIRNHRLQPTATHLGTTMGYGVSIGF